MNPLKVRWNWCWKFWYWRLGPGTAGLSWDRQVMAAFCFGPLEWQVTSPVKEESE